MRRVLPHTVALWVVLASPAAAAQVSVDRSCHAPGETVRLTGSGFTPTLLYTATLDRVPLGAGFVDDAGGISATFPAPLVEGRSVVRALDALGNRGRADLSVRRPSVRIEPTPRDARTARVRFAVDGLGGGRPVWLHWVGPGGSVRRSVNLGTGAAPCGELVTGPRRLLPFRRVTSGRWRLQLDTRERYDPETTPRAVQGLTVGRR